jgi:Transposase DDE domain group 1
MTPNSTDYLANQFNFGTIKGRKVIANFTGGRITSDAGIILLAELDKKKLNFINSTPDILAGKSTINRLEYCPETVIERQSSRYHKIEHDPKEIEKALVEIFLADSKKPPKQIVLDMDVTDDQVHGNQEGAFFNPYYKGVCYAPLYIFCGHHLLVAKLRSSNVDPAAGALEELQRIIGLIREKWQDTHIIIRGDSAYSREDIMSWSEAQPRVDYVLAMATNNQLKLRASDILEKAKADYNERLEPVTKLMETLFSLS